MQIPQSVAKAKAHSEPHLLRSRAEQAWNLVCTPARAFASHLLELCATAATDGPTPPTHEVLRHTGVKG